MEIVFNVWFSFKRTFPTSTSIAREVSRSDSSWFLKFCSFSSIVYLLVLLKNNFQASLFQTLISSGCNCLKNCLSSLSIENETIFDILLNRELLYVCFMSNFTNSTSIYRSISHISYWIKEFINKLSTLPKDTVI